MTSLQLASKPLNLLFLRYAVRHSLHQFTI